MDFGKSLPFMTLMSGFEIKESHFFACIFHFIYYFKKVGACINFLIVVWHIFANCGDKVYLSSVFRL